MSGALPLISLTSYGTTEFEKTADANGLSTEAAIDQALTEWIAAHPPPRVATIIPRVDVMRPSSQNHLRKKNGAMSSDSRIPM
jgi:hypothetical protein